MPVKTIYTAAFVSLCLLSSPANATAVISCYDLKGQTEANIILGAGPVPIVYSATVKSELGAFSTNTTAGHEPASIARSFVDAEQIKIDLIDDQATNLTAKIRILRVDDPQTGPFQIGYIQLLGSAPVPVTCDGP